MAEAFFARLCILVEGPTESEAIPIYARHLGFPLDEQGISIVAAGGKTALDALHHIYSAHGIPTYLVFDNDEGLASSDKDYNKVLCRLLEIEETDSPARSISGDFAILGGDWEKETERGTEDNHPGLYTSLVQAARIDLGLTPKRNKPLVARYVAQSLVDRGIVPEFVSEIIQKIKNMNATVSENLRPEGESDVSRLV